MQLARAGGLNEAALIGNVMFRMGDLPGFISYKAAFPRKELAMGDPAGTLDARLPRQ
jgi:hypothetical protein